jgi:hypothetical protein
LAACSVLQSPPTVEVRKSTEAQIALLTSAMMLQFPATPGMSETRKTLANPVAAVARLKLPMEKSVPVPASVVPLFG